MDLHVRWFRAENRETGEDVERWLTPARSDVLGWIGGLPGPVAVTYEAGPTGFVLAPAQEAAGISCQV